MPSPVCNLAIDRVFSHEGGFSNNPFDPGGRTQFGITERVARKNGYSGDMRFLPVETAREIYEREYWLPIHGDDIPPPLAFQLFDFAVNSGPPTAIAHLQRILDVGPDGIFGPITLNAVRSLGTGKPLTRTCFQLIENRSKFQQKLPTWPTFGSGWTSRNLTNVKYLLGDLNVL